MDCDEMRGSRSPRLHCNADAFSFFSPSYTSHNFILSRFRLPIKKVIPAIGLTNHNMAIHPMDLLFCFGTSMLMFGAYFFDQFYQDIDLGITPTIAVSYVLFFIVMRLAVTSYFHVQVTEEGQYFDEHVELVREYGRPHVVCPPEHDHDAPHNSLFRNAKDMVFLSAYIYEHALLLESARKKKDKKLIDELTPSKDISLGKMLETLNNDQLDEL